MGPAAHQPPETTNGKAVVVARPRDTDALGQALARAFGPSRTLPADIGHLIDRLDSNR